jgi:hypothetical protein
MSREKYIKDEEYLAFIQFYYSKYRIYPYPSDIYVHFVKIGKEGQKNTEFKIQTVYKNLSSLEKRKMITRKKKRIEPTKVMMVKREKYVKVMFSEEELNQVKAYVKNNGLSTVARYLRDLVLRKIQNGVEITNSSNALGLLDSMKKLYEERELQIKTLHAKETEDLKLAIKQQSLLPEESEINIDPELVEKISTSLSESPKNEDELSETLKVEKPIIYEALTMSGNFKKNYKIKK